jgi:FdhD protein
MHNDATLEPAGWQPRSIVRHRGNAADAAQDRIADEWPVALVFNGISHAVMMATPRDLEAFAVGFALTEGIVARNSDVHDIEVFWHESSASVELAIVQSAFAGLKERRRTLAGRTGCGVCGIDSLDALDLVPEQVADTGFVARVAPDAIARARAALPDHQPLMRATGAVHAAAWCDASGSIVRAYEDVGRHNALDKLIGALTLARADLADGFVFLSSRASYELVRKAARVGISMVATISAPTALAVGIAERAGIALYSFCNERGYVEYARAGSSGAGESGKSGVA